MDIVIDTSIIVAVIAHEPQRDALIELTRGADLLAQLLFIGRLAMPFPLC